MSGAIIAFSEAAVKPLHVAACRAANVKNVTVKFFPADREVYDWMRENGHSGAWVRELIRREYERAKGE